MNLHLLRICPFLSFRVADFVPLNMLLVLKPLSRDIPHKVPIHGCNNVWDKGGSWT